MFPWRHMKNRSNCGAFHSMKVTVWNSEKFQWQIKPHFRDFPWERTTLRSILKFLTFRNSTIFWIFWIPFWEILVPFGFPVLKFWVAWKAPYVSVFIYYFPQIISALKSYMIQDISIFWELYDYNIYIYKLCKKM